MIHRDRYRSGRCSTTTDRHNWAHHGKFYQVGELGRPNCNQLRAVGTPFLQVGNADVVFFLDDSCCVIDLGNVMFESICRTKLGKEMATGQVNFVVTLHGYPSPRDVNSYHTPSPTGGVPLFWKRVHGSSKGDLKRDPRRFKGLTRENQLIHFISEIQPI